MNTFEIVIRFDANDNVSFTEAAETAMNAVGEMVRGPIGDSVRLVAVKVIEK